MFAWETRASLAISWLADMVTNFLTLWLGRTLATASGEVYGDKCSRQDVQLDG